MIVPASSNVNAIQHEGVRKVAKLTTEQRNRMSESTFAIPEDRAYPIPDRSHAQNALARVSQHGSSEEKARVRAAVHKKYPTMGRYKSGDQK
jgi:hypothetical protein